MTEKTVLKKCIADDLETLCMFSRKTYEQTFARLNTPENMQAYLDEAFNLEKLYGELSDRNSSFYYLYTDDNLCGYLKLNESPSQTDINDAQSLELERIYVDARFQGKGLGRVLIEHAIEIARKKRKLTFGSASGRRMKRPSLFIRRTGFTKSVHTPL